MTETTMVVRLRRHDGKIVQDCDVYIGRACDMGGWHLPRSKWANPFRVSTAPGATVREKSAYVVQQYREWIQTQPRLLASLEELRGKRLGCWCKVRGDEPCHGDVLVEMLTERGCKTHKRDLAELAIVGHDDDDSKSGKRIASKPDE